MGKNKILAFCGIVAAFLCSVQGNAAVYDTVYSTASAVVCSDATCPLTNSIRVASVTFNGLAGTADYTWIPSGCGSIDGVSYIRPALASTGCFKMNGFGPTSAITTWASSIGSLQAITTPVANQNVTVASNRGGNFYWVVGSLPCDSITGGGDGGTTFCTSNGSGGYLTSGYWQRQYNGNFWTAWWDDGVRDIGAQINAAYAALPSPGGYIYITQKTGGGCQNFSTPIVLATLGKYVGLFGTAPGGPSTAEGSCLNFTPTSGTAITLDYPSTNIAPVPLSSGLFGITLVNNDCSSTGGCGGTAIGIATGLSNGGDANATYDGITVQGFSLAYQQMNTDSNTTGQNWSHFSFIDNITVMTILQSAEHFTQGQFVGNGKIVVAPSTGNASEIEISNSLVFANTGDPVFDYTSAAVRHDVGLSQVHLENSPSQGCHYFQGNVSVRMVLGAMEDTNSVGTCDWMINPTVSNATVNVIGTLVLSARTMNALLHTTSTTFGLLIPNMVNTPTAMVDGTNPSNTNTLAVPIAGQNIPWYISPYVQFDKPILPPVSTLANIVSITPCTTSGERGLQAVIGDAVAPTYLGAAVGGGTVVAPIVCSGTGGWVTY